MNEQLREVVVCHEDLAEYHVPLLITKSGRNWPVKVQRGRDWPRSFHYVRQPKV